MQLILYYYYFHYHYPIRIIIITTDIFIIPIITIAIVIVMIIITIIIINYYNYRTRSFYSRIQVCFLFLFFFCLSVSRRLYVCLFLSAFVKQLIFFCKLFCMKVKTGIIVFFLFHGVWKSVGERTEHFAKSRCYLKDQGSTTRKHEDSGSKSTSYFPRGPVINK